MSGQKRWRRRHPVRFALLGEAAGLVLAVGGAAAGGLAAAGPGLIVMLAAATWGLVQLGRRLLRPGDSAAPAAGPDAASDRPEPPAADRRVRVLLLGDSASGKTTLLASLYHRFVAGGEAGIRFAADDASHNRLWRLVKTIRDPGEEVIVPGTRLDDVKSWEFHVRVESGSQEATAFTLEYLDYPGAWVEQRHRTADTSDPPDPQFEQALGSCDVLMGVLDGQKVGRLLNGADDPGAVLSIENLLAILARSGRRNIHLVVTKWDLVRGPGGAYFTISDLLDDLDQRSAAFRAFRRSPRLGNMRVIPVSALGVNGFVRPNPEIPGAMQKRPGQPWRPWNIDLPFFCAVPDILRHDVARLARHDDRGVARITEVILDMAGLANFNVGLPGLSFSVGASSVLTLIRQWVQDRNQRGTVPAALSEGTAISYVLNECYARVADFEQQFPDSRGGRPAADA